VWKDFSRKYVAFFDRARIFVLLLWLGLALAAVPGVLTLSFIFGMFELVFLAK
jgi:hypothetical protein